MSDLLGNINFWGSLANILYWLGIGVLCSAMIAVIGILYYFLTFDHKVIVYKLFGSGKDGIFQIGPPKKNRIKWVKKRTAWRSMWPFMNAKDRQPFDDEYIYPGKTMFAFELNGEWFPGRININKDEKTIRAEVNPVPFHVRNWQSLTYKKHEIEFAQHDWWQDNKFFIMGIITVGICCALTGATIYFVFKFLGPVRGDLGALTSAIKNFATVPSVMPN